MIATSTAIASAPGQLVLLVAPLALITLALTVFALIDLVRQESVRGGKLVWGIVIIALGTLGPITYLIFGRKADAPLGPAQRDWPTH
jgi:hypothetical protein